MLTEIYMFDTERLLLQHESSVCSNNSLANKSIRNSRQFRKKKKKVNIDICVVEKNI